MENLNSDRSKAYPMIQEKIKKYINLEKIYFIRIVGDF
jgi:hypothetical protein